MRRLLLWILPPLIALACTPARVTREACYAQLEAATIQRAHEQCPGSWESCPARPAILRDLAEQEAGCP